MGSIFTQFMSDSDSQLILDLDFFKHFFNYAEAYRRGMEEGHVDYMKYAVFLVEKMKQFDVSPGWFLCCLNRVSYEIQKRLHTETIVDQKYCSVNVS